MLKLFISQPMNGLSKEEILKERKEVLDLIYNYLDKDQYYILNNFDRELDFELSKTMVTPRVYMLGGSVSLLGNADVVIFTGDWRGSNGCVIEEYICKLYEIPMVKNTFSLIRYLAKTKRKLERQGKEEKWQKRKDYIQL